MACCISVCPIVCLKCLIIEYTGTVKIDFSLIYFHHLCAKLTDFFLQFLAGLHNRHTCGIGRGGSIGTGIIRRNIRIHTEYYDVIHRCIQAVCRNLCHNSITACSHVRTSKCQRIRTIFIQLNICAAYVNSCNGRTLHSHGNTDSADLAISHIPAWIFGIPVHHLFGARHTAVHGTALCIRNIRISRKRAALYRHIHFFYLNGIHSHLMCQLIYCRFHCKNTLGCTITTIGTCRLHICIDNIKSKSVGFCMSVKSD